MNARRETHDRRVTALLVAVHVGVSCAISVAALVFGGGFAGPPMPVDEPAPLRFVVLPRTSEDPRDGRPSATRAAPTAPQASDPRDRPPPWRIGPEGRLLLPDR